MIFVSVSNSVILALTNTIYHLLLQLTLDDQNSKQETIEKYQFAKHLYDNKKIAIEKS